MAHTSFHLRNLVALLLMILLVVTHVLASQEETVHIPVVAFSITNFTRDDEMGHIMIPSAQQTTDAMASFQQPRQSCSCPTCNCNVDPVCPKSIPASTYVVASSITCSSNQAPGIGLVNIIDTNNNGFTYYLVDENNKNKAVSNQQFSYSTYKSIPSGTAQVSCISDPYPAFRFQDPVGMYMLVRSSNAVFSSAIRFNVQMSCVTPPYTSSYTYHQNGRVYLGKSITMFTELRNRLGNADDWQQGTLQCTNCQSGSSSSTGIVNGKGSVTYTPTSTGYMTLSLTYTPNAGIYGSSQSFNSPSFYVYQIGQYGSITVPSNSFKTGYNFTVQYQIRDSDNSITPELDPRLVKVESFYSNLNTVNNDISCVITSTSGSASVECMPKVADRWYILTLSYNGKLLATSSNFNTVFGRAVNGACGINFGSFGWLMVVSLILVLANSSNLLF
ncbi:hypothetical protein C9374_010673 [Naegleria lovaniensis]|uniref:Uncharacterized protein n=1 Tax=Naegleria lovaniensis TaxID=51637 RepID=A0AA88GHG2_NAELO|nr:uncharacterized protein C9374_010673 [Naegleria lovaniensis]KAG2374654.1 hypothetical protein C9374_010673 [Naegleria lovaniensis]